MARFFVSLSVAFLVNLDSISLGIAYSIKGTMIPPLSLLYIGSLTGFLTAISMWGTSFVSSFITVEIADLLGAFVLMGLGFWQLIQKGKSRSAPSNAKMVMPFEILKEPVTADTDLSGTIDFEEALSLGIALGLDAMCMGLGAPKAGFPSLTVLLIAIFCPLFLIIGQKLGRFFKGFSHGSLITGAVFLAMGFLKGKRALEGLKDVGRM